MIVVEPTERVDLRRLLRDVQPTTPDELHGYIRAVLGFDIPRRAMQPGMQAPFEYVCHSFFETPGSLRDCVVWANRGGGKTQIGAITTLLDLVFKPGIQVRILGGSFDQSSKMYAYLREIIERDEWRDLVNGKITGRTVELVNGSCVEVLFQSERSVRGQRVQKLRCDEVDVFTEDVWRAAQFTTRSARCGDTFVNGCIEVFSTMHKPFGLMQRLVDESQRCVRQIFKWSVLDVLERCPESRDCESCDLLEECQRRAKASRGFFHIDDAIQQKRRTLASVWRSEMLCERPVRTDCVYPEFDIDEHVHDCDPTDDDEAGVDELFWVGGMDFGYRSPTVFLWAFVDERAQRLCVVDEYIERERSIEEHVRYLRDRPWPTPSWIGIDPAGYNRHESSGKSAASILVEHGFRLRTRRSHLQTGIEAVRARLRGSVADGGATRLVVHPRCRQLNEALAQYHYPPDRPESLEPVKDGHDHACDALRYLVINLDLARQVKVRSYV